MKLTGSTWTLCTGWEHAGLWYLNDSTGEDGAQEYAVVYRGVQIETITFGWDSEAEALRHIRDCAGACRGTTTRAVGPAGGAHRGGLAGAPLPALPLTIAPPPQDDHTESRAGLLDVVTDPVPEPQHQPLPLRQRSHRPVHVRVLAGVAIRPCTSAGARAQAHDCCGGASSPP